MARTVRNAKIDTRSTRTKLKARREPHWTPIQTGCAIGYRKGATGGTWIVRFYNPEGQPKLRYHASGSADDAMDGDGVATLTFAQAQESARTWFGEQARKATGRALRQDSLIASIGAKMPTGRYA